MKKLAVSLFAILPFALYAQEAVKITGTISGVPENQKVFLVYGQERDSIRLENDGFHFSLDLQEPQQAALLVGETLGRSYTIPRLSFYLEPGEITITGAHADLSKAQVSGGAVNAAYAEFLKASQPVEDLSNDMRKWYQESGAEERKTEAFQKEIQEKNEAIVALNKDISTQFAKSHPNSVISIHAIENAAGYSPDLEFVESLFQALDEEVKNSPKGKKYAATLETLRKTAIGAVAPVFTQQDTAGVEVSLTKFRGQYVLLDFWASWCGPCRTENPNVVKSFQAYQGKNFTVLGVSLDNEKGRENWLKAIYDDGLQDWTQLSDLKGWDNAVSKLYGVRGIPANYLIDPSGKIVAKNLRGEALEKKLEELL